MLTVTIKLVDGGDRDTLEIMAGMEFCLQVSQLLLTHARHCFSKFQLINLSDSHAAVTPLHVVETHNAVCLQSYHAGSRYLKHACWYRLSDRSVFEAHAQS